MIGIQELRELCGVEGDGEDRRLIQLEAAAVAWVEGRTRRYFGPRGPVEERITGTGSRALRLAEAPLEVPEVVVERAFPGAPAHTIHAADELGFELVRLVHPVAPNLGRLERKGGGVWTRGFIYIVEYERGYEVTAEASEEGPAEIAAPDDIRHLVGEVVRFRYAATQRAPGVISESIGDYSYSTGAVYQSEGVMVNMIPGAGETLRRWARPVYA